MNRFNLVVLLAFVSGCNGEEFTTFSQSSLDAPDAAPGSGGATSTGGVSSASTGGAPEADAGSGGASQGTGGSFHNTGGSGSPETGGAPATGGVVVDACASVTHDNGFGATWQDCVPLGTYNLEQAMKACAASGVSACAPESGCPDYAVHGALAGNWGYEGIVAGYASATGLCGGPAGSVRWR
jgi:hypothetical protein